ncbi:hypothetical protein Chor_005002 [Crotalus horridus]
MPYCGPSCAVPSCASAPVVGFGSAGSKGLGCGLGYAGLGYGYGLGYGHGLGYGYGAGALAETSGSLGTLAGVIPSCINQVPPSEVTIQPPAVVVTIPGPILSASCDPVTVGGNTPCAPGGFYPIAWVLSWDPSTISLLLNRFSPELHVKFEGKKLCQHLGHCGSSPPCEIV